MNFLWLGNISQSSWGMDCRKYPWLANNDSATSGVFLPHLLWHAHCSTDVEYEIPTLPLAITKKRDDVGRGLSTLPLAYSPWSADIGHSLHALPFSWTQLSTDFGCGFQQLSLIFTYRSAIVKCFLLASSISCTHWSTDVKRVLPTSSVAESHRFANVKHGLAASLVAIIFDLSTSEVPTHIVHGLHVVEKQRRVHRRRSRSSKKHAHVHVVQKSKEYETPFSKNNIFMYFRSIILNVSVIRGSFVLISFCLW